MLGMFESKIQLITAETEAGNLSQYDIDNQFDIKWTKNSELIQNSSPWVCPSDPHTGSYKAKQNELHSAVEGVDFSILERVDLHEWVGLGEAREVELMQRPL